MQLKTRNSKNQRINAYISALIISLGIAACDNGFGEDDSSGEIDNVGENTPAG